MKNKESVQAKQNIYYLGFMSWSKSEIKAIEEDEKNNVSNEEMAKKYLISEDYINEAVNKDIKISNFFTSERKTWDPVYNDICYCSKCKNKFHSNNEEIKSYYDIHYASDIKIICPHCNNEAHTKEGNNRVLEIDKEYVTYRNIYNDNPDKLVLTVGAIRPIYYNGHVITKMCDSRIVINMKTGYSYMLPLVTRINNSKTKKVFSIYNCTYCYFPNDDRLTFFNNESYANDNCNSLEVFIKKAYNIIRDYKMKKYKNYIPTFEEAYEHLYCNNYDGLKYTFNIDNNNKDTKKLTIGDLFLFNRTPYLKSYVANQVLTYYSKGEKDEKDFLKIRRSIKQEDTDILKKLLLKFDIPASKNNKKNLANNGYEFIVKYNLLKDYMSIDNINKIINIISASDIKYINEFLKKHSDKLNDKTINNICNKTVKENRKYYEPKQNNEYNTTNYYNYINYASYVGDIFRFLISILEINKSYKIDWKLDIKDLHDKVSSDLQLLQNINREIDYSHLENKEKQFEGDYGDLHFALAKDTDELIKTGSFMHICVGSYRSYALSHQCYIVIARDDNGEPIICIEINDDTKTLRQTKLKYNELPKYNKIGEALLKWIEANKLDYKNCYDTESMLEEKGRVILC